MATAERTFSYREYLKQFSSEKGAETAPRSSDEEAELLADRTLEVFQKALDATKTSRSKKTKPKRKK